MGALTKAIGLLNTWNEMKAAIPNEFKAMPKDFLEQVAGSKGVAHNSELGHVEDLCYVCCMAEAVNYFKFAPDKLKRGVTAKTIIYDKYIESEFEDPLAEANLDQRFMQMKRDGYKMRKLSGENILNSVEGFVLESS